MSDFFAAVALLPEGWARDVRITVDEAGTITGVTPGEAPHDAQILNGPVVPGMANLHSHAFQRALAGRLERMGNDEDSFWTWRRGMYEFVRGLEPDDVETIAAQTYVEMLEGGYTSVGEFHYLHHTRAGNRYRRRTEMADRLIAAARAVRIGMTLLPVLYERGGNEQARFVMTVDEFVELWDELATAYGGEPDVRLGAAPHSLRAVSPQGLIKLQQALATRDARMPLHIHVAEQKKEVDDCVAAFGETPVSLLLRLAEPSFRWTFVHATHVRPAEVEALAAARFVVALCPTTEANLGDGVFPADAFVKAGGAFGIGSDSHVTLDVAAELRLLEYGQRLLERRRNVLCTREIPSVGEFLYRSAASAGAYSLGRNIGALARGASADFVVLESLAPALAIRDRTLILDGFVFTGGAQTIRDVFVGGRLVVEYGRHIRRDEIAERYRETLMRLATRGRT
ncbi:MAG: formimidoylglutamate deiminase [Candidatus Eremiobacteraeota bacterium]|nr:formimidoylglutamate deiminase [Candidatus Eremiobacteraeota bacterium]